MKRILLCAPIHEKEEIFKLYLKHLRKLDIPESYQLDKCFILHNCEELKQHLLPNEMFFLYNNTSKYNKDEITHYWNTENFSDVTKMKNALLDRATANNYDYIFYVDSDLMLHKNTLTSLINADKDMIAEIFWTKWDKESQELPNCWHFDHYQIYDKGLKQWKEKGYYRVGMTGACTLIKRKVFSNSVINWNPVYNISHSMWEDRAFCTRVAVANYEIWIDTNYPAVHLYRDSITQEFQERGGVNE